MIKIYGIDHQLNPIKAQLSDTINQCMVEALSFPENKRAHRFFPIPADNFFYPDGRSQAYTVIEITLIEGRSESARKQLIYLLFDRIQKNQEIDPIDIEITIQESPACNWGFRGRTGDDAQLDYNIKV